MYSEKVMEHFEHPRNVGEIPDASGTGTVGNAKCGDIMKMDIKVENDIITDVKFKTFGCCAAIATSSMATEMVKGKSIDEALQLTNKAVAEALDGEGLALRDAAIRSEDGRLYADLVIAGNGVDLTVTAEAGGVI